MSLVPVLDPVLLETNPVSYAQGAEYRLYERGTDTPVDVFLDEGGAAPAALPLITDEGGIPRTEAGDFVWVEAGKYDREVYGEREPWVTPGAGDVDLSGLEGSVAVIRAAPLNVQDPEFGAVGDNSADDTEALKKAAAPWEANGGTIYLPRGLYKVSESEILRITRPDQTILGDGESATILKPDSAVAGKLITQSTMPASDKPSGSFHGFQIDGEAAGEGAVGLSMGDLVGASYRDFAIRNFTKAGHKAIEGRNLGYWTEECVWDGLTLDNNKVGLELSRAAGGNLSFGYHTFSHLRLNVFAGQVGIRLLGDVKLYNAFLRVAGNLHGACVGIELAEKAQIWGELVLTMEAMSGSPVWLKMAKEALLKGTGHVKAEGCSVENEGVGNIRLEATGNPLLNVASAEVLSLGYLSPRVVAVTGSKTIKEIVPTYPGHVVTFRFPEGLTIKNGKNLILGADFVGGANSTLSLACDGTNFYPA